MRLWHEELLPILPNHQLLGQHRECCALRGLGWGKKHSIVDYVFQHPHEWLWAYHMKVIWEMKNRGYSHDPLWDSPEYRGLNCEELDTPLPYFREALTRLPKGVLVYPEHDSEYLMECLDNLRKKGIELSLKTLG